MAIPNTKIFALPKGMDAPIEVSEVSLLASEEDVRAIALFLLSTADEMKRYGEGFGHSHFRDKFSKWPKGTTDIIVCQNQKR